MKFRYPSHFFSLVGLIALSIFIGTKSVLAGQNLVFTAYSLILLGILYSAISRVFVLLAQQIPEAAFKLIVALFALYGILWILISNAIFPALTNHDSAFLYAMVRDTQPNDAYSNLAPVFVNILSSINGTYSFYFNSVCVVAVMSFFLAGVSLIRFRNPWSYALLGVVLFIPFLPVPLLLLLVSNRDAMFFSVLMIFIAHIVLLSRSTRKRPHILDIVASAALLFVVVTLRTEALVMLPFLVAASCMVMRDAWLKWLASAIVGASVFMTMGLHTSTFEHRAIYDYIRILKPLQTLLQHPDTPVEVRAQLLENEALNEAINLNGLRNEGLNVPTSTLHQKFVYRPLKEDRLPEIQSVVIEATAKYPYPYLAYQIRLVLMQLGIAAEPLVPLSGDAQNFDNFRKWFSVGELDPYEAATYGPRQSVWVNVAHIKLGPLTIRAYQFLLGIFAAALSLLLFLKNPVVGLINIALVCRWIVVAVFAPAGFATYYMDLFFIPLLILVFLWNSGPSSLRLAPISATAPTDGVVGD